MLYCSKCRVQLILYSTKGKSINTYVLRLNIVRLLSFLKRREREGKREADITSMLTSMRNLSLLKIVSKCLMRPSKHLYSAYSGYAEIYF